MIQPKNQEPAAALEKWPDCYYHEFDRDRRLALLDAKDAEKEASPEDAFRRKLYEQRYIFIKEGKKQVPVDAYMRAWMMMSVSGRQTPGIFGKKKMVKEWEQYAAELGLADYAGLTESEKDLQFREWKALFDQLIGLCLQDKNYTSQLLGLMKLKEDSVTEKIAADLENLTANVPESLGRKELFAVLHQAAEEAWKESTLV